MAGYEPSDRDRQVIEWVLACRNEADEARRHKLRLAELAWRDYFNEHDFSRKAGWQTKVSIPLWAMGVDQIAGAVQQSLQRAARLFTIEVLNPNDPVEVARAQCIHDILHLFLHEARLPRILGDVARVGVITNLMAIKARVEDQVRRHLAPEFRQQPVGRDPQTGETIYETQLVNIPVETQRVGLSFSVINPRHLYLDPLNRGLYRIQTALKDRAFLDDPRVLESWNPLAVEAALQSGDAPEGEQEDLERAEMQTTGTRNPMRSQVRITEYWGDLRSRTGRRLADRRWVVLLDDRFLALESEYPFWHGEDPYVVANLLPLPFTPYGKLLYQHVGSIGTLLTEMVCLIADAEKFATLGVSAVDVNVLEDVEAIVDGLYPGLALPVSGQSPIQQLKFPGASGGAHGFLAELRQLFENGMATTEFLSGAPSVRGRATATETQTKTALTATFLESMTNAMQVDGIEPLVEKSYWNVIQFVDDWSEPRLAAILAKHGLTPADLGADPVRRYQMLKGSFRFHVSALTAVLRRTELMERLLRFFEVLGNQPAMLQQIGPEAFHKLFEKLLEVFDFQDLIGKGNQLPSVVLPGAMAPSNAPPLQGTPFALPPEGLPNLGAALRGRG